MSVCLIQKEATAHGVSDGLFHGVGGVADVLALELEAILLHEAVSREYTEGVEISSVRVGVRVRLGGIQTEAYSAGDKCTVARTGKSSSRSSSFLQWDRRL